MTKQVMPQNMLRGRLCMYGLGVEDLARLMERSRQYVSARLKGQKRWTKADAALIMLELKIKPENYADYFGTEPVKLEV